MGSLGGFDHGVQVTYNQGQLKQLILAGTHRIMTSITSFGNSCQAAISYELLPGKDHFELRNANNEVVNISALTAERVSCKVSKGDVVGPPPTADAAPAAKDQRAR